MQTNIDGNCSNMFQNSTLNYNLKNINKNVKEK